MFCIKKLLYKGLFDIHFVKLVQDVYSFCTFFYFIKKNIRLKCGLFKMFNPKLVMLITSVCNYLKTFLVNLGNGDATQMVARLCFFFFLTFQLLELQRRKVIEFLCCFFFHSFGSIL